MVYYMITVFEMENELKNEIDHLIGFRQQTAKYALEVLHSMQDLSLLENRSQIYTRAVSVLENVSIHQIEDVVKMLNVIFSNLNLYHNLPDEIRRDLDERKHKRTKITLTRVED